MLFRSDCHLWNIFQDNSVADSSITSSTNSTIYALGQDEMSPPIIILPSDIEFKENLIKIGKSKSGINIYQFNYIGTNEVYQGVVAQELLGTVYQNALITDENGKYLVNYSLIDVEFKKINI